MAGNPERPIGETFASDIELVASLRLRGVIPLSLEQEGKLEEAQVLRFIIGRLEENLLMGLVTKRMEELSKNRAQGPQQLSFLDPERKINQMHKEMHNKWERKRVIQRDENHQRQVVRRNLGLTESRKRKRAEEATGKALLRLEELGWLEMIVHRRTTTEEIAFFENIMSRYRAPDRDLDSSVGITIYPDRLSWLLDIYGGEHLFQKSRNSRKTTGG